MLDGRRHGSCRGLRALGKAGSDRGLRGVRERSRRGLREVHEV